MSGSPSGAAASVTRMCHAARGSESSQSLPHNTKGDAGREVGGNKEETLQDRWNRQPTAILSPGWGDGVMMGASSFSLSLSLLPLHSVDKRSGEGKLFLQEVVNSIHLKTVVSVKQPM